MLWLHIFPLRLFLAICIYLIKYEWYKYVLKLVYNHILIEDGEKDLYKMDFCLLINRIYITYHFSLGMLFLYEFLFKKFFHSNKSISVTQSRIMKARRYFWHEIVISDNFRLRLSQTRQLKIRSHILLQVEFY